MRKTPRLFNDKGLQCGLRRSGFQVGNTWENALKRNRPFGDKKVVIWENLPDYMPQNLLYRCLHFLIMNRKKKKTKYKIKFRQANIHKKTNYKWIMTITIITFFSAIVIGYFSLVLMEVVNILVAFIILFFIVFLGIFFDALGIAVTAANETPFHSMASGKVSGAKESITIIRNASSFANFFNDVIGDIAGIISGSAASAIIIKINLSPNLSTTLVSILLTAIIAGITIGGKGIGKEIAIKHANFIVYQIGKIIHFFRRA